jgi:hypothetical protein
MTGSAWITRLGSSPSTGGTSQAVAVLTASAISGAVPTVGGS